ncbi:MAG: redoxin domain-containing protein [Cyclobacteriaceae bacterium]
MGIAYNLYRSTGKLVETINPVKFETADGQQLEFVSTKTLKVGDRAPSFNLLNFDGKRKSMDDYLAKGSLILSFYRGDWCPYCNAEIRGFANRKQEIEGAGGQHVGISPMLPDYNILVKDRHRLTDDVLSDMGNRIAKTYGLELIAPPGIGPGVIKDKMSIDEATEDFSGQVVVPIPATLVIGQDGLVKYIYNNPDITRRANQNEIISVLKSL